MRGVVKEALTIIIGLALAYFEIRAIGAVFVFLVELIKRLLVRFTGVVKELVLVFIGVPPTTKERLSSSSLGSTSLLEASK